MVGTGGGITFANTRLLAFTGSTVAALRGDRWLKLLHQEDREQTAAALSAAVRARQPFTLECRLRNRDGDHRWVSIAGTPRSSSRRWTGYLGIVTEVTPRHAAEHAASQASSRLHLLATAMDEACVGVGPEEEIVCWNRAVEQYTGVPATETIGHPLNTVLTADALARVQQVIRSTGSQNGSSSVESLVFRSRPDRPLRFRVVASGGTCILVALPASAAPERDDKKLPAADAVLADRLKALLQTTEDIVVIQDPEGRYLYYNGPHGYDVSEHEIVGKFPAEVHDREFADRLQRRLLQVVRTGEGITEESFVKWNGQGYWFLDQLSPMKDLSGAVSTVATISRNITTQKNTEQRLREGEDRYRTFVINSNEGIWRIETNESVPVGLPVEEQVRRILNNAYVAECNASLARLFGYDQTNTVIGARFNELLRADAGSNFQTLTRFVESGYRLMNWESELLGHDGVTRSVLHNVVGTVENGALVRAWGSISDITERKDAERRLRLLAHTITSTRDCVSLTDLHDRILFVNDAFLSTYGFPEEELLGQDIARVRPGGEQTADLASIQEKTLEGGWYGELVNRRADGTLFPVELWTSVVRNDEGEPVAMVGVARDITARRQAEEELRSSLREKEVLLKEIHHRVKNNLQVISSLLSLQSEYLKDPEMVKVFKESQNRVRSMALIHEKLYQSRNLAEIDFGDYLRELTNQLLRSYGIGAHGVSLDLNATRVLLAVDRAIPCGIIVNELVTNALKYAFPNGRDGRINIDLHPINENRVRLIVRDNGVGFPEQVDFETSESLGLTLVRMLAEQVQGEMVMQPGRPGAEFTMTFRK